MPHLITGDRLVGRFTVPWKGTNQLMRADQLPDDALRDSNNVLPRQGSLRKRPGYSLFNSTTFNGTPTGMYAYWRGGADPVPVLATTTKQYAYDSGNWVDKTGTGQTANNLQPARFTSIALGTPATQYVIHTNGADAPTQWTGSGTFAAVAGSPPKWTDICTVADHVIGIVPPYGVQWGNIRAIDTWPALNIKQAAETSDPVVALRPLGQGITAVLYKDRSLWGVTYTGGQTEASAFRFDFIGWFDGPASPAAVVDVDGQHVYMTPTGRIAAFSGSQQAWIADGLWPLIRADIDTTKSARVWGFYDPINHEIHFFYPSLAQASAVKGWVGISLPKQAEGINDFGAFRGTLSTELSAGATIRLTDKLDRLLTAGTQSYQFSMDSTTDNGTAFSGYWQTGLLALPGLDPLRMEAVETFAERANGYGQLTVKAVTSFTLDNDGTVEPTGRAVNLSVVTEQPYQPVGLDTRTRFLGLRYDFSDSSALTLKWKGATLPALRGAR